MNWYKFALDFSDRNLTIHKILYLKDIRGILENISKMVFQNGTFAKSANVEIVQSKQITSYPVIRDILIEADNLALDNPWKFASLCEEAVQEINNRIYKLQKERDDFGKKGDEIQKGWI
jgi:hypothetical protein